LQVVSLSPFPIQEFNSLLGISEGALIVKTKYFEVPLRVQHLDRLDLQLQSIAIVLLGDSELQLSEEEGSFLRDTEHAILFTQSHSEELASLADSLGVDYASQDLTNFTGFLREDYENVGLARVKETIELAVGSEVLAGNISQGNRLSEPQEQPQPEAQSDSSSEDEAKLESELELFDTYMQKIRETALAAKDLSDDDRRDKAEALITEVMRFLKIDD